MEILAVSKLQLCSMLQIYLHDMVSSKEKNVNMISSRISSSEKKA